MRTGRCMKTIDNRLVVRWSEDRELRGLKKKPSGWLTGRVRAKLTELLESKQ